VWWDLVAWLERCASIPMITSSNPSGGSELTSRSDLLFTARGGSRLRERSLSLPDCRVTRVTHTEGLGRRYTNPQIYVFYLRRMMAVRIPWTLRGLSSALPLVSCSAAHCAALCGRPLSYRCPS
jgi:hypothetical protein